MALKKMTSKFWFQLNAALLCLWLLVASGWWWGYPSGGSVVASGIFAIPMVLVAVIASFVGLIIAYVKHQSIRTWAATHLLMAMPSRHRFRNDSL